MSLKEKRSNWDGFTGYLQYIWAEDRKLYLYCIIFLPVFILANYLQVYLPKMVVEELEENKSISYLAVSTLILVSCLMISTLLRVSSKSRIEYGNRMITQNMQNDFTRKLLYVDYKYLEDKRFLSIRNMIKESLFGGDIGEAQERARLMNFLPELVAWIAALGTVFLYIIYLWKLSPWLLLLLCLIPLGMVYNTKTVRKNEIEWAQQGGNAWQKLDYITHRTEDFSMAKDIRLYGMNIWFTDLSKIYLRKRLFFKGKELKKRGLGDALGSVIYGAFYICFYWCIIQQFLSGTISAADMIFYAGIGPALLRLMDYEISSGVIRLSKISQEYNRYIRFMSYGEDTGSNEVAVRKEAPEIELQNLSFSYPDTGKKVLDNLNLKIGIGEKVAIVGVNGAGKTTLMKLICGLLHPTSGKILLNGKDMELMEAEERYAWFSCAFQDIQFLPLSVGENISMKKSNNHTDSKENWNNAEDETLWSCLEKADMKEVVEGLSHKLDTLMEKSLNEEATDFSGGQRQKLILARALYRDAGVLILDEPTAALDALAENDIYEKYAEFAKNKTSFFVSHRLSSTRFCDRILLLDGGHVAEEGTHEELLAQNGLYAKMFAMQSKYYKEGQGNG